MATNAAVPGARFARLAAWPSALATLPRWSVLLLVAVAARAATFGNPVVHVDEEFYFTTAIRMLHGALPYVDVWDRKPIGLFLVYLPAAAFGVPLGIWVYQAMATASVVLTGLVLARLAEARRLGNGRDRRRAVLHPRAQLRRRPGRPGAGVLHAGDDGGSVADPAARRRPAERAAADGPSGARAAAGRDRAPDQIFGAARRHVLRAVAAVARMAAGTSRPRIAGYGAVLIAAALAPTALAWAVYAALGTAAPSSTPISSRSSSGRAIRRRCCCAVSSRSRWCSRRC
ncbi:MAG: hypothetical protein WDN44_06430 [Sphingomonas sp.]